MKNSVCLTQQRDKGRVKTVISIQTKNGKPAYNAVLSNRDKIRIARALLNDPGLLHAKAY